jgi:ABC-2 type transport system ATP-binding protein
VDNRPPIIQAQDLRKKYGRKVAVSRLCLSVPRGTIFGFLGPNGAGKSTSIKMLLGLVRPTSGAATVLGAPAGDVESRRRIGFLPEHFRFYDWLTPLELVRLHGRLCGVSPVHLRERVPALVDLVGLTPHRNRLLRQFSKGMMQRAGLAQALVHEPDVIFLDEPTSGLDPMGRRLVRDIIRAQRERGATVFLNSHLLSEIEITCDRVVFIRDGEVVAERDLLASEPDEIVVRADVQRCTPDVLARCEPQVSGVDIDNGTLRFTARSREDLPAILRCLVDAGVEVSAFTPERTSLEELFIQTIGEDRGL